MRAIRQLLLILLFSLVSAPGIAQLDTQPLRSLNNGVNSSLPTQALGAPVPLPQDKAFPFYVSVTGSNQLRVSWNLAPAHYLYRHAFHFALQTGTKDAVELSPVMPAGRQKTDEFFGDIEAYYDQVSADLTLPANLAPNTVLVIEYQGCADWGFCYPPQRREYPLAP